MTSIMDRSDSSLFAIQDTVFETLREEYGSPQMKNYETEGATEGRVLRCCAVLCWVYSGTDEILTCGTKAQNPSLCNWCINNTMLSAGV